MEGLARYVEVDELKGMEESISQVVRRGGTTEIVKRLAVLSLAVEKMFEELGVQRQTLDLICVPIATEAAPAAFCPKSVQVTAEMLFDHSAGVHQLEYDRIGTPFRWTDATSTFNLEVLVDRSTAVTGRLRLLPDDYLNDAHLNKVHLYVDGIHCSMRVERSNFIELCFDLPARHAAPMVTRIQVECPVWSPSQVGEGSDERSLGVPFLDLNVEPAAVAVGARS